MPFYGEIRAQDGTLKNKKDKAMKPEAIMEMDWLTDNVIGEIPTMGELRAEARPGCPDKRCRGKNEIMKILVIADEESQKIWISFEKKTMRILTW